jgi:hypothetical protein
MLRISCCSYSSVAEAGCIQYKPHVNFLGSVHSYLETGLYNPLHQIWVLCSYMKNLNCIAYKVYYGSYPLDTAQDKR